MKKAKFNRTDFDILVRTIKNELSTGYCEIEAELDDYKILATADEFTLDVVVWDKDGNELDAEDLNEKLRKYIYGA